MAMIIGPRFQVKGIEPAAVRAAPPAARRDFWGAVAAFVIEAKDAELRAGLDRHGNPMAALSRYTIEHRYSEMGPADPHAPPLQPAHGLSRTRSLFTAEPTAGLDGVTCWWLYDEHTGASWGKILAYHRDGGGRLPRRDVIGLAPASVAAVKARAAAWWASYEAGAAPMPAAARETLPTPAPKFLIEPQPRYRPLVPANAIPKSSARVSQLKINGHVYTLQSGSAAQIRRGIANKTFSGFGKVERTGPGFGQFKVHDIETIRGPRFGSFTTPGR